MSPRTKSSADSSISSEAAWEIDPAPSRLLAAWHVAVHALAAASVLACGLDWPIKIAGCAVLVAHAVLRPPPAPTQVSRHADGSWSLPALGLERLWLRPGSAAGPFWSLLRLGVGETTNATILLLPDQLDRDDWRRLQIELRHGDRAGTD